MPETLPLAVATGSPEIGIIASAETKMVEASSVPASEIAPIVDRLKPMAHLPPELFAAHFSAKCSRHSLETKL